MGAKAIRRALYRQYLQRQVMRRDTIVIDELGLAHAQRRIDIAVISAHLHGYEIKSDLDTLVRLPDQLELYTSSLQKLTVVSGTRHLQSVTDILPNWVGLWVAHSGPRGGISFERIRRARLNSNVDPFVLAHLLWRGEAEEVLKDLSAVDGSYRMTRKELYANLVETLSTAELVQVIKCAMVQRRRWRADQLQR